MFTCYVFSTTHLHLATIVGADKEAVQKMAEEHYPQLGLFWANELRPETFELVDGVDYLVSDV